MNRTDHAVAIIRDAIAMYASVGSSSCGLALERFTALLLQALVSVGCGIEGGDFEQRTEQDGLVDCAQAGLDHDAPEPLCCTGRDRWRTGPYPVRGQAVRTDSGRPSSSMRFRTWTATSISVARRSSVRERSLSPITRLYRPTVASARARAL